MDDNTTGADHGYKDHQASPKKLPYTGILLKAINPDEAKPRGLRAPLAVPADESDKLAHIEEGLRARYAALDKFFGLKSSSPDIWERRAKELIAREFNIAIDPMVAGVSQPPCESCRFRKLHP